MDRSLVVDTDTASDDAVALLMAARDPRVSLRAVTVVAGNVPVEIAVRNAIVTLDLAGAATTPVYVGLAGPVDRALETAQFVHGEDGMAGVALPSPSRAADDGSAVDLLLDVAAHEPHQHDLVTLGPLTNVAAALDVDPDLLTRFGHVYLMAGAPDGVGNVNALGEYNVWADPEAATVVLQAAGAKTLVGWNVSRHQAVFTPAEQDELRGAGRLGEFAVAINAEVDRYARDNGLAGFDLPDPVTMAVAIDDSIVRDATYERLVVGTDEPTRGACMPDRRHERLEPNIQVVWSVDEAAFKRRLIAACRD